MYEITAKSLSEILVKFKEIESDAMKQKMEFNSNGNDSSTTKLGSQSNQHESLQCNSISALDRWVGSYQLNQTEASSWLQLRRFLTLV
jgi:hypothetical protein